MITKRNVAQTSAQVYVDQGLRQYMMRVYNYMAGGLCITALASYIIMNTPALLKLFFTISANGGVGLSGLGWLAILAPFIMVFAFGWVLNRGSLAQVQGVYWGYAALMGVALTPVL